MATSRCRRCVAGFGIALLPEFLVWRQLREGSLVPLLPEWAPPLSALHVVTPPGAVRPARVSVLVDFLVQHFQKAPWAYEPTVDPA